MPALRDTLPDYLRGKFQTLATVTFTAFFGLAMMLMLSHFSRSLWFSAEGTWAFALAVAFFVLSLLAVSLSRRLMYKTRGRWSLTLLHYLLWSLGEAVIIAAIYLGVTFWGAGKGLIPAPAGSASALFFNALLFSVVCLSIPYSLCGMYFALEDKNNTIRLMNYGNVVTDEAVPALSEQKITLFDNSGMMKLSVSAMNLYYIESDDNYIKVWYTDAAGVLKQYMLRCRLKTVEEGFRESSLVRCHRKYIVNMMHAKVLSREKDGYVLTLDGENISPIPVSKTYEDSILEIFNSR